MATTTDTSKRAAGFVATAMAKTPIGERAELLAEMMRQCAQGLCHINGDRCGATGCFLTVERRSAGPLVEKLRGALERIEKRVIGRSAYTYTDNWTFIRDTAREALALLEGEEGGSARDLAPSISGAHALGEARHAELLLAAKALGALPEGYCFCSRDRVGDDSKVHEPECADLRAAIAKSEVC